MAEITYCGAAGLHVSTDTHRRCVEHDGSMRIVAPSRLVARLLAVTRSDSQLLVGAHRLRADA
jgi:anti-anti-sigma regulatory factor